MSHLLLTNDFPPRVGGIQSYLWELWRRLPPERVTVLAPRVPGASRFDAAQRFRIERWPGRVLLPTPAVAAAARRLADEVGAKLVVVDPALPLGLAASRTGRPYVLVLHGAEVTVPGRLPVASAALRSVLRGARHVVAAGGYPLTEARRVAGAAMPPATVVPPGVDPERFTPLDPAARLAARRRLALPVEAQLVVSVSRLVPRKGMDTLIAAAARLRPTRPQLLVAIAGAGRDRPRLERLAARARAPVRFLGKVPDEDLPALVGCADVFAMLCRSRWGGLEQEGFGIVFLEAAGCAVPQVAGCSGGAGEAVVDGETGIVLRHPRRADETAAAIAALLDEPARRERMGAAARRRAVQEFAYPVLAARLDETLRALER